MSSDQRHLETGFQAQQGTKRFPQFEEQINKSFVTNYGEFRAMEFSVADYDNTYPVLSGQ